MFPKLHADSGWCRFSLGRAKCHASYLTGGALDFVDAFIDRLRDKCRLNVELNEECARTALVETESGTFVIQTPDPCGGSLAKRPLRIYDVSNRSLCDLTFELLRDVEADLEGWATFKYHYPSESQIAETRRRVALLRSLAEHRWRWGDPAQDRDWSDSLLAGDRPSWEFCSGWSPPADFFRKPQSPDFLPDGSSSWFEASGFYKNLPPPRCLRPVVRPVKKKLAEWFRSLAMDHPALKKTRLYYSYRHCPAFETKDGTLYLVEGIQTTGRPPTPSCLLAMQIPPQGGIAAFATLKP